MKQITQAVISDAGVASRFFPVVKSIPKSFIPIGSKPVLQLLVEECLEAGLNDIIVVARPEYVGFIQEYFANSRDDIKMLLDKLGKPERYNSISDITKFPPIRVIEQSPELPYGTATPLIAAKDFLKPGEPFVYIQGDDIVIGEHRDCMELVKAFSKFSECAGFLMVQEMDFSAIKNKLGVVKLKGDEMLDYVIEKPQSEEESPSMLVSYGRFLYTYKFFDYLRDDRFGVGGELWNVDALTAMAKDYPVKVIRTKGRWMTTGDPNNYLKALVVNALQDEGLREELRGLIV